MIAYLIVLYTVMHVCAYMNMFYLLIVYACRFSAPMLASIVLLFVPINEAVCNLHRCTVNFHPHPLVSGCVCLQCVQYVCVSTEGGKER